MFKGDRLKHLREHRGITHQELAAMLDVGYAQIYRYENNKVDPVGQVLDRMASLFDVSVDYLLGRTDNPTPHIQSDDLTDQEIRAIAAWRQGNIRQAIREIVNDGQPNSP
jgi:transcriptional regulator with XRE-family HTH domain